MSEGSSRQEMERRLVERSLEDESFRRRLLEDPKGAVEEELGTRLPESVEVRAVEETQDTIYLVLPSTSVVSNEVGALSDRDLESVAGGGTWGQDTCQATCGANCTPNCTGDFICTS